MADEQPDLFKIVGRDREITAIRERLAQLESEKVELEVSLNKVLSAQQARQVRPPDAPVVRKPRTPCCFNCQRTPLAEQVYDRTGDRC